MDEREILRELVAGNYFKKDEYFTEGQLVSFSDFVQDFRSIIKTEEGNKYFKKTIKNLISSDDKRKVLFGVPFGRFYCYDKEVVSKLEELAERPTGDNFQIRVQAIYELLDDKASLNIDLERKERWADLLYANLDKYKQLFRQVYLIHTDEEEKKYRERLQKDKLLNTSYNKKWVYLIELAVLAINEKDTLNILNSHLEGNDTFTSGVAKRCLEIFN